MKTATELSESLHNELERVFDCLASNICPCECGLLAQLAPGYWACLNSQCRFTRRVKVVEEKSE